MAVTMTGFLSEEAIRRHIGHLDAERLRLSVEKKCEARLGELDYFSLSPRMARRYGGAAALMLSILMHECYFSSFTDAPRPCEAVRSAYGSEDAFLYEGLELAREVGEGFIYVFRDRRGVPRWGALFGLGDRLSERPVLAVDLYEHAYFYDYSFDRGAYLRAAMARIDLGRL